MQETVKRDTTSFFQSVIANLQPEISILATAEARIWDICITRNAKVKESDYGIGVVIPRTKMPFCAGYKDAYSLKAVRYGGSLTSLSFVRMNYK